MKLFSKTAGALAKLLNATDYGARRAYQNYS